jgi:hypothetical protein
VFGRASLTVPLTGSSCVAIDKRHYTKFLS